MSTHFLGGGTISNPEVRFFAEMESYIKRLVTWTKDSKDAIDALVADLKNAVELVASK
jgi:hypothetical protein